MQINLHALRQALYEAYDAGVISCVFKDDSRAEHEAHKARIVKTLSERLTSPE